MSDECDRLGRYLLGVSPSSYVREWYARGIDRFPERFAPRDRLDAALLALGRTTWIPLRAVDMAARFVRPASSIRRRLVFLAAVLENAPDTWERFETPAARSIPGFAVGLAGRGVVSALALGFGLVVAGLGLLLGVGRSAS